jgi:hypothetical protein
MAVITAKFYPGVPYAMYNNDMNIGDTYKMALLTEAGVYDSTHTDWSDLELYEIDYDGALTGYAQKATTLSVGLTSAATTFGLTEVTWTDASFTFRHAVVYNEISGKLLLHLTFSVNQVVSGQNYKLNVPSPVPSAVPV